MKPEISKVKLLFALPFKILQIAACINLLTSFPLSALPNRPEPTKSRYTVPNNLPSRPLSLDEKESLEQVMKYLYTHSFEPILLKENIDYSPIHFERESSSVINITGIIEQAGASYTSVISVKKDWLLNSFETRLLFITTDDTVSTELFYDIANYIPRSYLPDDPANLYVFYERIQEPTDPRGKYQRWCFFNSSKSADFQIGLTGDGHGGTFFTVQVSDDPEKQKLFFMECFKNQHKW